jgi:CRISPR/Cas system CSM-associated protein Csm3 (group 7 of RAMP superfamily)
MILGTSIAGVLRKAFSRIGNDAIFGWQEGDKGEGSRVILSNALLLDERGRVQEGLLTEKSNFLRLFENLPIREHTAITDKGVAKEHSKFDEEIVYKGSRFRFALEYMGDKETFDILLESLSDPAFRLGGGSTKGFGKFKVITIGTVTIDTLEALEHYDPSLNSLAGENVEKKRVASQSYDRYIVTIVPDDFFMFGSGFGDQDADQTPVTERVVDYEKGTLSDARILMPASSIKGALVHRTTYHYNLQQGYHIGNDKVETNIPAIFGQEKGKDNPGSKGRILFSDLYHLNHSKLKIFDHVSIDRFTGGAIEGALFQEKTVAQRESWEIEILVEKGIEQKYVDAFKSALDDLCGGMLPLGGNTTKGHGIFNGSWSVQNEEK